MHGFGIDYEEKGSDSSWRGNEVFMQWSKHGIHYVKGEVDYGGGNEVMESIIEKEVELVESIM